ncbi:unnamed protein product, partial [Mesorhabditis spiculigera]
MDQSCQTVIFQLPNESIVYEVLKDVRHFYMPIHTYLSIFMCILGTITNFCNIVVLTRRQMRTPVNMILTAMACCDTVVLFSNLIFTTHYSFVAFKDCHPRHWSYGWSLFLIAHAHLSLVGHSSSVWLSVMLAAIRYQTLRSRGTAGGRPVGLKHSYVAIAGVICFVTMLNTPNYFTYKITEDPLYNCCNLPDNSPLRSTYCYLPKVADIARANECLVFRLAFWMSGVMFKLIPCLLLSLLVWLLLRILREVKENRHRLLRGSRHNVAPQTKANGDTKLQRNGSHRGGRGERTDRTTQMLLAIVFVLLVTELPQGVMAILSGIFSEEFRENIYNNVGDFLDLLSLCGACTSFIIYCTMSGQFRNEFRRVFLPTTLACSKRANSMRRMSSEAYTKMTLFPPSRADGVSGSFATPSPDERSLAITVVGSSQQIRRNLSPSPMPVTPGSSSECDREQAEDVQQQPPVDDQQHDRDTIESIDSEPVDKEQPEEPHEATLLLNGHPVSYL